MTSTTFAMVAKPAARGDYMVRVLLGAVTLAVLVAVSHAPARSQDPAPSCVAADVAVRQKLLPLFRQTDAATTWLVRNSIASARIARAYCNGDTPERGLMIYRRIIDTINTWTTTVETSTYYEPLEFERWSDMLPDLDGGALKPDVRD